VEKLNNIIMTSQTATTYHAFSSASAQGNPAGVIILPKPGQASTYERGGEFPYEAFPPTSKLQDIATGLGLPMTAFALPLNLSNESSEAPQYAVRWFNLTQEAPLCGHATLALSHHLFNSLPSPPKTLRYLTRLHGIVSASLYPSPFEDTNLVGIEFPELKLSPVTKDTQRWEDLKSLFNQACNPRWEANGEPLGVFEQSGYLLIEYSPDLNLKALQIDSSKLVSYKSILNIQGLTFRLPLVCLCICSRFRKIPQSTYTAESTTHMVIGYLRT
jgi:hypothetical protein